MIDAASRSGDSWSSDGLLPLTDPNYGVNTLGWDENLTTVISDVKGDSGRHLASTDIATGATQSLASLPSSSGNGPTLAALATDPAHFIFIDKDALAPGAVAGVTNLYDFDHGALTLAGRIPPGAATSCDDSTHSPDCVPAPAGSAAGAGVDNSSQTVLYQNTISADGSKVFFNDLASGRSTCAWAGPKPCRSPRRRRALPPTPPNRPPGSPPPPAARRSSSAAAERLTADSTAVSTADNTCSTSSQGADLYRYDTASGDLTDLTVDSNASDVCPAGATPCGAQVRGLLGASADGSYVYFVANGVLASGASPGNCGSSGNSACSVYLYHDGTTTFVARLTGPNLGGQHEGINWENYSSSSVGESLNGKGSRVSPAGALLFTATDSVEAIGGYDNQCGNGHLCAEIFRYAPGDAAPTCISCNPTGSRPSGDAWLQSGLDQQLPGGHPSELNERLLRNLSSDGTRVFFDSADALLAADVNGVSDVYEWEADGAGSCHSSATNGGCLYLISTGTSPYPSYLDDASASGDDVFIFTFQSLLPSDADQLRDVYDARVDGGLPSQHQAVAPPCGSADQCHGQGTTPPAQPGAGTGAVSGSGNPPLPTCRGDKVNRGGRCVARHPKKHHRKRKHHKRSHHRRADFNRGGSQ